MRENHGFIPERFCNPPHLAWSMDAPNYRTIDFVDVENKKFIKQVEGHIFYWMTRIREYGQ